VVAPAPRRPGCLKLVVRGILLLVALGLGALAWDVWQLRGLQPPDDRSFEGFVRAGRQGSLRIDREGGRLYWTAPPARTVVRFSEPPVYEFDRSGQLVNWTPGPEKGMIQDVPVRVRGAAATTDDARTWMRSR
jgi:hypothetical protein